MEDRSQKNQKLLIHGGYTVTLDEQGSILEESDILVDSGIITDIRKKGTFRPDQVDRWIDARGKLITPGFVNAHTHSPLTLAKGSFDRLDHANFMWRNQADTANRTPREIYISAVLGAIEMLKSGTTALIDNFPEQNFTKEDVDAVVQAYRDIGMRAHIALRVFDKAYSDILPLDQSILPQDLQTEIERSPLTPQPYKKTLDICRSAVETWHSSDNGRIGIMIAPSAPLRCTDEFLLAIGAFAEKYNVGIHTHLLESEIQTVISQKSYGKTLVEHLDSLGLLSSKLSCAHSIWLTDNDIDLLAEKQVSVVHNPSSNLKLGSGIAPIPEMFQRGVNIALGTDGASTNDNLNLLEAIKLLTMLHRPGEPRFQTWISDEDALRMATRGGAVAMLQAEEIGSIEVGKKADLVLFNLDTLAFIPFNDPIHQLVYCENGTSVDTVLIDGQVILEEGTLTTVNEDDVLREVREISETLKKRNRNLYDFSEKILPYIKR